MDVPVSLVLSIDSQSNLSAHILCLPRYRGDYACSLRRGAVLLTIHVCVRKAAVSSRGPLSLLSFAAGVWCLPPSPL